MSAPTSCGHKAGKAYDRVVPGPDSCTATKDTGEASLAQSCATMIEALGGAGPVLIWILQQLHFGHRHNDTKEKVLWLQSDLVCSRRRP